MISTEEFFAKYDIVKLDDDTHIQYFDCGDKDLNDFKRKQFPREKYLRSYPSAKIGRLGVSSSAQGLGLGTHLLYFIKMYFLKDNKTGCRFITVDAYNDAVSFYERNGFEFLQAKDEQPTQLMYFDLMTIKKPI